MTTHVSTHNTEHENYDDLRARMDKRFSQIKEPLFGLGPE